jgi:hypothetical protein
MLTSVINRYVNVTEMQLQLTELFIILYTTEDNETDMYVNWCNWNTVSST